MVKNMQARTVPSFVSESNNFEGTKDMAELYQIMNGTDENITPIQLLMD